MQELKDWTDLSELVPLARAAYAEVHEGEAAPPPLIATYWRSQRVFDWIGRDIGMDTPGVVQPREVCPTLSEDLVDLGALCRDPSSFGMESRLAKVDAEEVDFYYLVDKDRFASALERSRSEYLAKCSDNYAEWLLRKDG